MRYCLILLMAAGAAFGADARQSETLQGKLVVHDGQPTAIQTTDHKLVGLDGDDSTKKVLADDRLNGFDIQVKGHFTSPGHFQIDPIHTHSLLVRRDGHLKMVSYWCDVCSIRSYTPGPCVCCQKETVLDLRDPDAKDDR